MTSQQASSVFHRKTLGTIFKRTFLTIVVLCAAYFAVALTYASKTIYKVKRNYAVIIETVGGERQPITEVGWHSRLPIFTTIEAEVSLMNQELYLAGQETPSRVMSKGNVALLTSAMMTYRISDLQQWGIENRHPEKLLQTDFDGLVKDLIQGEDVNTLVSERQNIKERIYSALKLRPINEDGLTLEEKYGIKIVSFVLRDTSFGDKLAEASEDKKTRELIAEAENYAADLEASRTRKLYAAYKDSITDLKTSLNLTNAETSALFQFLNQQKWAAAYEKNQRGQNTFVMPSSSNIVLPSPTTSRPQETSSQLKTDDVRN